MSDYRRLISYIYEYEGKEKGKNVGFVKLEARNGQCRLNLNVKKVYVGGNAIGVYLLGKNGAETFLGNIFIRNGSGEFRAIVDAKNVESSGNGLDTYYGLTVHDVKNPWRSYTTIWEDAVVPEMSEAQTPALPRLPAGDAVKLLPAQEILPGSRDVRPAPAVSSVIKEIEAEIAREEERRNQEELSLAHAAEVGAEEGEEEGTEAETEAEAAAEPAVSVMPPPNAGSAGLPEYTGFVSSPEAAAPGASAGSEASMPPEIEKPAGPDSSSGISGDGTESENKARSMTDDCGGAKSEIGPGGPAGRTQAISPAWHAEFQIQQPDAVPQAVPQSQKPAPQQLHSATQAASPAPQGTSPAPQAASRAPQTASQAQQPAADLREEIPMRSPELENPDVLRYLQETEDVTADPEKLWQELRKSYPKIQPFDYEGGCEILTIRPQDIGRLPRESWVYGNNSFLLHGYYNFRYIILFRLGNKDGRPRYLIGVPGHYYSSEKYMASMFGFPNFVLSKKQPPNDGRFGYWYTDIRVR